MLNADSMAADGKRVPVPGIVRREEGFTAQGHVPVGLVSWECGPAGRLRLPVQLALDEIDAAYSPVEVLAARVDTQSYSRTACLRALGWLKKMSGDWTLHLGVWGSAAMELHTGYRYTHAGSDVDCLLKPTAGVSIQTLTRCLDAIGQAERNFQVRVDVELSVPGGYGVSLKELLDGKGSSVLGKGLHDVVLLPKSRVFACLSA